MIPDIDAVSRILREVSAAEIMPRFRNLAAGEIKEKGPGDLVTVADEAAERVLTRRLSDLLPGSLVVGEEAYAADPGVLDRLSGDQPVWIIDPVDGTHNFANGKPIFGTLLALAVKGQTMAGWIHDPNGDRMVTAVRGEGAWMDGRRLKALPPAAPSEMRGAMPTKFCDPDRRELLESRRPRLGPTYNLFCAAHEYLKLALGEGHFSLYHRTMPWDHAAGVLVHGEAGGYSAKLDGTPYLPTDRGGGILMAPDKASWLALRDVLLAD